MHSQAVAVLALGLACAAACAQDPAGPLASTGVWLSERGITPNFAVNEFYQANPSSGAATGNSQAITLFSVGADLDLARLLRLDGATVHFEQLFATGVSNLNYRADLGDAIAAVGAPYLPKVAHLQTLTFEQKLLDGKLELEVGKSNAIYHFATGLCNLPLTCQNSMLLTGAGFNPFPYADWSARIAYDLTPRLRAQLGAWRSNPNFFNHNGWQRRGDANDPVSSVYLANLVYRSSYAQVRYPATYEVMAYHNTARQTDRFVSATGSTAAQVHEGTDGLYLAARKVIYRPDQGPRAGAPAHSLSAYGSWTHSFDPGVADGIANLVKAGLIEQGLFRSRPNDSYSISADWGQMSRHRQRFTESARLAGGGPAYGPGRDEFMLTLDANFVLTDSVGLSPFVRRSWRANNWFNPVGRKDPADGYLFGVTLHLGLDRMLGLNAKR